MGEVRLTGEEMSESPKHVPNRPVWAEVYRNCVHTPSWKDQELVAVTRETLRLAQSALRQLNAADYYHNYGAAEREIIEVLANAQITWMGEEK
jgi:hypothetical protein